MVLFERDEFLDRAARAKKRMVEAGIDILLIASPANQFWLTGYDGWSFYTPQMVILALDEEEPIWYGRKMDSVGARFTVYMGEDKIIPYPDAYVASPDGHPMEYLAGLIKDRGWGGKRIGVEKDDYYYTARWHEILTRDLPNATFVDAFLLINWCRLTKSEREIHYLREAGTIGAAAMRAAIEACEVGVRQCDVMAELYKVTVGGTPEIGGTFPCKPPNAMVGELCSAPHLSWTDERLKPGDMFYIEQGGVRHRYHSPLSRCVYLGKPTQAMTDTTAVIVEGLEAVLATVKPGIALEELEAAWRGVIARHGIVKDSRIGYPVGIGYPPTWGELTCSLRQGDKTILEPGMTFHCIPALWLDKYGLVVSESFVVTETGAETFANFPRVLFAKDA
ncbi:Xaa-Pro aminopeptidase [Skermanella stibiiresistens SB22]|uniref:Xaa-Pro aminopeptidase n=1 Tax=Skermanella stibiiresistens SB22 TaxID=1385369 RepID=W9HDB3_9PROT|nr:Xaa-Pro aminopeptidase [Skermanella stibiiresistens SB22]